MGLIRTPVEMRVPGGTANELWTQFEMQEDAKSAWSGL
jgi:hypothetical protein